MKTFMFKKLSWCTAIIVFVLCTVLPSNAQNTKPFRSLAVGNKFVYSEYRADFEFARHYEQVLRDTIIDNKRYAVVLSSIFGGSITMRLERSDESKIYVYQNGKEEVAHNFYLKIGDTVQANLMGANYSNVVVTSVSRSFNSVTADSTVSFSSTSYPNTSFIYAQRRGFSTINRTSNVPSGIYSMRWVGSVIDGQVIGDISLGRWTPASSNAVTLTSSVTALTLAVPNPFATSTRLNYTLTRTASVSALVYASDGVRVATLLPTTTQIAGDYTVEWNGISSIGSAVAAGQYFVALFVDDKQVGSIAVVKQ